MRTLVKYGAPWCGPCRAMDQLMERGAKEYPDIKFKNIDIESEEGTEACDRLKIIAVPTIVAYHNDQIVSKNTGGMDWPAFRKILDNLMTYEQ